VELKQDKILSAEAGAVFAAHAGPRALGAALIRA
jgi:fatty acid-binding protein DegV